MSEINLSTQPSRAFDTLATGNSALSQQAAAKRLQEAPDSDPSKLRETFDSFVGQTLFSQMLAEMRRSTDKPAYFNGGRAEEVFQGQLDQHLAEEVSQAASDRLTGPMFDLFMLNRSN